MPEVSRFFGIVIRMYYNDHDPAHFHAEYGEQEQELKSDWDCARRGAILEPISPLE
jgi:hypothetical protein